MILSDPKKHWSSDISYIAKGQPLALPNGLSSLPCPINWEQGQYYMYLYLCVSHWEFGYSSNSKFHYHMHASRCSHYHPFTSHHQPSIISHIVWTFLVGRKFHFTSLSWHANALSVQSSATLEDISAPELRHFCNIATSIRRCRILPPHV